MKKSFVWFFVLLFVMSFVFAVDGWGDINVGGNGSDGSAVVNGSEEGVAPVIEKGVDIALSNGGFSGKYTLNFYIALGAGVVGVLFVALFVYLFLRKPRDKWSKKRK